MTENISVFDFSLTEEDVARITALERDETAFYRHNTAEMVEKGYSSFEKARNEFKELIGK